MSTVLSILRQIKQRRSQEDTDPTFPTVIKTPAYLKHDLSLENLCMVQVSQLLQNANESNLEKVSAQCDNVPHEIKIKFLQFMIQRRELNEFTIPAALPHHSLAVLILPYNTKITDAFALRVAPLCSRLEVLDVRGCGLSFRGVTEIAKVCSDTLVWLDISGKSTTGEPTDLINLLSHTPNLKYLAVRDSYKDFSSLVELPRLCPHLQQLELAYGHGFSAGFFEKALSGLPELTWLDVSWGAGVDDAGVKAVARILGPKLQALNVEMCCRQGSFVSDASITDVAQYCPNLERFSAKNLQWVTDASITVLAQNCPKLKTINISGCEVTDVGLGAIANHCEDLESLSVLGLYNITDQAVTLALEKCKKLEQIDLANCVQITQAMRSKCDEKLFTVSSDTGAAYVPFKMNPTGMIM